jgi:hypothetical protein
MKSNGLVLRQGFHQYEEAVDVFISMKKLSMSSTTTTTTMMMMMMKITIITASYETHSL